MAHVIDFKEAGFDTLLDELDKVKKMDRGREI